MCYFNAAINKCAFVKWARADKNNIKQIKKKKLRLLLATNVLLRVFNWHKSFWRTKDKGAAAKDTQPAHKHWKATTFVQRFLDGKWLTSIKTSSFLCVRLELFARIMNAAKINGTPLLCGVCGSQCYQGSASQPNQDAYFVAK